MSQLTGHPLVDAIAQIHFEGDITPRSWYKHICYQTIKTEQCKADRLAIDILSDIVYWYRPSEVRDEITGEFVGWKRKFTGEILRRSPDAFAEALNATVRCVRESIRLLENLGLITVVIKPIKTPFGVIPNVMHIEVVPEAIAKITHRVSTKEKAETTEKSLLTKWVTRVDEMGNEEKPNSEQAVTVSGLSENENSNLSIYRDLEEISSETSLPPTPQGGESENNFGFQIPKNSISNLSASLELKSESLHLTTNQSVEADVPPAPIAPQKIKYDAALGMRPPRQRAKYKYPDGPWLNEKGQMRAEFIRDRAILWRTGDTTNSKAFGAMAIEDVEGLVCDHYMKPQNHAKLENDWNAFISKNQRYVGNVQQRLAAGININETEQQKIIAIAPSLVAEPIESAYGSSEALEPARLTQSKPIAQLESVATVDDDVWDSVAQQMEKLESQNLVPEGADNPAAYQNVVKPDERDFWANRHEIMVKSAALNRISASEISESNCHEVLTQLVATRSMPKWDREKENQQKRPRTKVENWNDLLASGLPTVIADVERQARAQGYVIVDGQISEVDF